MTSNWNKQTPSDRARVVAGMFDMAARGQAIRASRELDRAVECGDGVEQAIEVAKQALREVLS